VMSGCQGFQGYLYSRPGSAQELEHSIHGQR
jgi:EAL domain-containing protein (putative c-di-GMP-specific phosphodiesterase class I)